MGGREEEILEGRGTLDGGGNTGGVGGSGRTERVAGRAMLKGWKGRGEH